MHELYAISLTLAERIALRDIAALDALYDQYAPALYGIILKVVPCQEQAGELLTNVFLQVWRNMEQYDPARQQLSTWLLQLTNRLVRQHTWNDDHTAFREVSAAVRISKQ